MTSIDTNHSVPARNAGRFWALFPVVLLGSSLVGLGTMASIATRDPSFALERDYYQRAVRFDEERAQQAENERLRFQLSLEANASRGGVELVSTLVSKHGAPLPDAVLRAEAFANARAGDIRELEFRRGDDGRYRAFLERATPGLWEFRFTALDGKQRFTSIVRRDVPKPLGGAR